MDSTSAELFHGSTSDHHYHHHTSFLITKGRRTKRQRSSITTMTSTSSSHAGGGSSGDGGARSDNDYYSSSSTATQPDHVIASHLIVTAEEEDMANCLILLGQGIKRGRSATPSTTNTTTAAATAPTTISVYECKTCNRTFPSFQALGGHRASHKKPNPIPTVSSPSDQDLVDDQDEPESTNRKTINTILISSNVINNVSKGIIRVHECSICGSEFSSGQALGGHMRRHRAPPLPAPSTADRPIPIDGGGPRIGLPLDLNLPAPNDDEMLDDHMETEFHVLPTPALVLSEKKKRGNEEGIEYI